VGDPHAIGDFRMSVQRYGIAGEAAVSSPLIWKDCPMGAIAADPSRYIHIWDDFAGVGTTLAAAGFWGDWLMKGTNGVVAGLADESNGVITVGGGGTAHDDAYLHSNALYDLTMNNNKRFWFEIRLNLADADADIGIFAGLAEYTACVADMIVDECEALITTQDILGFVGFSSSSLMGNVEAIYQQEADASHTDVDTNVGTMTNDAYIKLGMRFDGKKTVTFYVNGASVATLDIDDLSENSFTNKLAVIFGMKDTAGDAADLMQVDWVRFACEKVASGY